MDVLNPEQRRRNMQAIKSVATKTEVILAKALWNKGYRYRKNDKRFKGKPDITFSKLKIAIFCDGEFWHGKDWDIKKAKINVNSDYWVKKIERNMKRDQEVNNELESNGWIVLRFWHKEIKSNLEQCINQIESVISQKKGN